MRTVLPGFAGVGLPPREAFEALVKVLDELSLGLWPSAFLVLDFAEVARGKPVTGSTFSLSASSANMAVELGTGRPKERVEEADANVVAEEVRLLLVGQGGSWKIVNVGAIVMKSCRIR